MEKTQIKENLGMIPEIKNLFESFKKDITDYFSSNKPAEPAKPSMPAEPKNEPANTEPAKPEFNHEEFTKGYNEFKSSIEGKFKSYEEKFNSFEAQLKTANETITKQNNILTKTQELIDKVLALPSAMSKQKSKEGAKTATSFFNSSLEEQIEALRKTIN